MSLRAVRRAVALSLAIGLAILRFWLMRLRGPLTRTMGTFTPRPCRMSYVLWAPLTRSYAEMRSVRAAFASGTVASTHVFVLRCQLRVEVSPNPHIITFGFVSAPFSGISFFSSFLWL